LTPIDDDEAPPSPFSPAPARRPSSTGHPSRTLGKSKSPPRLLHQHFLPFNNGSVAGGGGDRDAAGSPGWSFSPLSSPARSAAATAAGAPRFSAMWPEEPPAGRPPLHVEPAGGVRGGAMDGWGLLGGSRGRPSYDQVCANSCRTLTPRARSAEDTHALAHYAHIYIYIYIYTPPCRRYTERCAHAHTNLQVDALGDQTLAASNRLIGQ
jgi:hypothetical protein